MQCLCTLQRKLTVAAGDSTCIWIISFVCVTDRLYVVDVAIEVAIHDEPSEYQLCAYRPGAIIEVEKVVCSAPTFGRYIKLSTDSGDYWFSFHEMEVIGH